MNALVYYHSVTGNTKRVAAAIAAAAGTEARPLSAGPASADLLFLGAASYATSGHDVAPEVRAFVESLDPARVRRAAVFTTGFAQSDTTGKLRRLLEKRGIAVEPEGFFCKGKFTIFQMGHPDAGDLAAAAAWAARLSGD